ncbi:MAG: hypothetical protein EXR73_07460 [Myxococcales bacterium]|nr:hypothetical protein [Myxococcales bacterium]
MRSMRWVTGLVVIFLAGACGGSAVPPGVLDASLPPPPDAAPLDATPPVGCADKTDCDDGIACTTDGCVDRACVFLPDDRQCDDGIVCNGGESCDAAFGCLALAPPDCDDLILCTTDACSEAMGGCVHVTDDALCIDAALRCDERAGCVPDRPCTRPAECNDGVFCNGAERCDVEFGCQPGVPAVCADAIGCTTDACDPMTDACAATPDHALCPLGFLCMPPIGCITAPECETDADCNDSVHCNGVERCTSGRCTLGPAPDCGDEFPCTVDVCDEGSDNCAHLLDHARCDDRLFCNGAETCAVTFGCVPGAVPVCADTVTCTADSCDDTLGCVHTSDDSLCDDGRFCTGGESCLGGFGCVTLTPPPLCADGNVCTDDSCSDALAACDFAPRPDLDLDLLCDDLDPDQDGDGVADALDFAPRDPAVYNAPIIGGDPAVHGGLSDGTGDNALTRFFALEGHYRIVTAARGTDGTGGAATITLPLATLGTRARLARAYLYRHTFHSTAWFNPTVTLGGATVATSVIGQCSSGCESLQEVRGEVSAIVAASYAARGGAVTIDLAFTESPVAWASGITLVAVFDDPDAPYISASLDDGLLGEYCSSCGARTTFRETLGGFTARGPAPGGILSVWSGGDGASNSPNSATVNGSRGSVVLSDISEPSAGPNTGIASGAITTVIASGEASLLVDFSLANDAMVGWALVVVDSAAP